MLPFYEALADRFHELHGQVQRDLDAVPPEALDWKPGPEMNSLSVIIVHLTGAERFLIGDVTMQDSSHRDRDAEFRVAGMSKADLVQRLTEAERYMLHAFEQLKLEDLSAMRIHPRHGNQVSVSWALLHALDHVATHVGHIQMTIQLWQQRLVGEG